MGLAGVGLAFLLEQLDNTLKTPEEAERYLRLPTLGVVPDFALLKGRGTAICCCWSIRRKPSCPAPGAGRRQPERVGPSSTVLVAEAYRSLRSSLLLSQAAGRRIRCW